jgi:hypothetical protein
MTTATTLIRRLATLAAAAAALALGTAPAQAQGIAAANAAFDAQFNNWLGGLQRQNQQYQQQIWQHHLQTNGPRLRQQYAQLVSQGYGHISFEQFAYWDLMTAAGTNVQGALQHQQNQFRGMQAANATVQQGHASYNAAMAQNSQRQSAAVANYTNQAVRGVAPYVDPSSGRQTMLPHYLPAGQVYQTGGQTYAQDASGTYWRLENNAWVRMNAGQ